MHPEQDLQRQLVIALRGLLTPATFFFTVPQAEGETGVPRLAFIHGGRAFHLELKAPEGVLTPLQRAAHVALRDAGARVEVARSLPEALARLREFGIPLRPLSLKSVFRSGACPRPLFSCHPRESGNPAERASASVKSLSRPP